MARIAKLEGPHLVDRHVGRRVEARRRELGLTQTELSRAIGVTFQQVQKYEKGANRVSASKLWEIAEFLKVDIAHFYQGLTAARPGFAESDTVSFTDDFPITRQASEIARLAPRLNPRSQKTVLALIRDLVEAQDDGKD